MMAILKEKAALAYLKNAQEMLNHRNSEFTPLKLLTTLLEIERGYQQLLANTSTNYQLMVQIERHGFPNLSAWFVDIKNALKAFDDIKLTRARAVKRILSAVFSEANSGAEIESHLLDDEAFLKILMKFAPEIMEYLKKANFGITEGTGKKVLIATHLGKTPFQDGLGSRTTITKRSGSRYNSSYSDSDEVSPASAVSIKLLPHIALMWFMNTENTGEISKTPLPISKSTFFDSGLFKIPYGSATGISLVDSYEAKRLSTPERELWNMASLLKTKFSLEALLALDFTVITEEKRTLFFTTLSELIVLVESFENKLKQFLSVSSVNQLGTVVAEELKAIRAKIIEFEWPEVRSILMIEVFKHFQALLPPEIYADSSGKPVIESANSASSIVPPQPTFFSVENFRKMRSSLSRKS